MTQKIHTVFWYLLSANVLHLYFNKPESGWMLYHIALAYSSNARKLPWNAEYNSYVLRVMIPTESKKASRVYQQ